MRLPVVWTAAAFAELLEAQQWYENRLAGLGERFATAVDATVNNILDNPRQFRERHKRLRRAGVRRFPYGLFFQIEDQRIVVIACFHGRRDPKRWQDR